MKTADAIMHMGLFLIVKGGVFLWEEKGILRNIPSDPRFQGPRRIQTHLSNHVTMTQIQKGILYSHNGESAWTCSQRIAGIEFKKCRLAV